MVCNEFNDSIRFGDQAKKKICGTHEMGCLVSRIYHRTRQDGACILLHITRFQQRPQKRSRGNQLIYRRLATKFIGRGLRSRESDKQAGRQIGLFSRLCWMVFRVRLRGKQRELIFCGRCRNFDITISLRLTLPLDCRAVTAIQSVHGWRIVERPTMMMMTTTTMMMMI